MQVVSQAYIYPSVAATIAMKDSGMNLQQRWQEFPFIVSDMLFPLLIEQLLTWYLVRFSSLIQHTPSDLP
jgi:sterol O-acyltransferase